MHDEVHPMSEPTTIHILVVDDEETLTDLLSTGLTYEGYQVSVAADGVAALAIARRERPHLVILDWMLPGLDGLTICRQLREQSDVSILMLTARSELAGSTAMPIACGRCC